MGSASIPLPQRPIRKDILISERRRSAKFPSWFGNVVSAPRSAPFTIVVWDACTCFGAHDGQIRDLRSLERGGVEPFLESWIASILQKLF